MKNAKHLLFIILLASILFSCKNNNETPQEKKARKQVQEIIKDLPNLKQEVDEIEKKFDAQTIVGNIEITANGKTLSFNKFSGKKSNINFRKGIAKYRFYTTDKRKEYVEIELKNDAVFTNAATLDFVPSKFPIDMKDTNTLQKMMKSYMQISYHNKNTNQRYFSGKGKVQVQQLTDNNLKLTYNGNGYQGDWRDKKFIPMQITVNIKHNFISYDGRNK